MGYYEIPYQAPVEGMGIAPPQGRVQSGPAYEPGRRPVVPPRAKSVGPAPVPGHWSECGPPGAVDPAGGTSMDVAVQIGPGYPLCVEEYCTKRGLFNQKFSSAHLKSWVDACNCDRWQPPSCQAMRAREMPGRHVPGAMQGLGIVPGASTRGPWCSPSLSYVPLQHMLSDLGFYSGPLNGEAPAQGNATYNAVLDFGRAHGVDLSAGITDPVCEQLINAHNARHAGGAAAPPAVSPAAALKSMMTYRYRQDPTAQQRSGAAPDGSQLVPAGAQPGWWDSQSTAVKAGIIVGGVAVLGVGAYALSSR